MGVRSFKVLKVEVDAYVGNWGTEGDEYLVQIHKVRGDEGQIDRPGNIFVLLFSCVM